MVDLKYPAKQHFLLTNMTQFLVLWQCNIDLRDHAIVDMFKKKKKKLNKSESCLKTFGEHFFFFSFLINFISTLKPSRYNFNHSY